MVFYVFGDFLPIPQFPEGLLPEISVFTSLSSFLEGFFPRTPSTDLSDLPTLASTLYDAHLKTWFETAWYLEEPCRSGLFCSLLLFVIALPSIVFRPSQQDEADVKLFRESFVRPLGEYEVGNCWGDTTL